MIVLICHFVDLDVRKNTFDASLMSADKKELSHKSFDNTLEGMQSILAWIDNYHLLYLMFCFVPKKWVVTSRSYLFLVFPWGSL